MAMDGDGQSSMGVAGRAYRKADVGDGDDGRVDAGGGLW